jgi:hypothetical protein
MSSKISHHELHQSLKMKQPDGTTIAVPVSQISIRQDDDEITRCIITLEIDPATYQQIDRLALFNLQPEMRGELWGGQFDPNINIEIEAGLEPDRLGELNDHATNVREVASCLLDANSPLLQTEYWLGLCVKQLVSLPPELAKETQGEVKVGYQTQWIKLFADSPAMMGTVQSFFQANGWQFISETDASSIIATCQGENGNWRMVVNTEEEFCLVYSTFPHLIPPQKRAAFMEFLTRANYELPIGNFEFDLDKGEVRFKTSVEVSAQELTFAIVERLVNANVYSMDSHLLDLQQLLNAA